jgi:hypothetical protein
MECQVERLHQRPLLQQQIHFMIHQERIL